MKYLLITLLILQYACSAPDNRGELIAKLRITVYKSKAGDGQSLLLLTTIFENITDKDIFFIKSPPWSRHFLESNTHDLYKKIPAPELTARVMQDCVNANNYLKRIIYSIPEKRVVVDSLAALNKQVIIKDYNNFPEKFKSQFLVLKAGEKLEVDNTPVYDVDTKIMKYEFLLKNASELLRRNKLGENIKVSAKIFDCFFWDGEIKLDPNNIEIVFKEI